MRAGNYNITCEQGSTLRRTLEIEQPNLVVDPTGQTFEPYDLSGYSARMQVRRTIDSSTFLLNLTTENGALVLNPNGTSNNVIYIDVSAEVTASVENSGVYDIELVGPDGVVSRILQGNFNLSREVTR